MNKGYTVSYRDFSVLIDLAYFLPRCDSDVVIFIDLVVYLTEHLGKIDQSLQTGIFLDFADFMNFLIDCSLLKVFRGIPNAF